MIVYGVEVDALSDLLHRARAKNAVVRQMIQRPPWSITLADAHRLSAVATLEGDIAISRRDTETRNGTPKAAFARTLTAGDIALIKGGEYTIADDLDTPHQVTIRAGVKHFNPTVDEAAVTAPQLNASQTFGNPRDGATVMLHGIYELHGSAGDRLLNLLPDVIVIPAGPRTRGPLELLSAEAKHDESGQDAVLNRLLDLVLVIALRTWGIDTTAKLPTWLGAITDPAIGEALTMLHSNPGTPWTTAKLAQRVGMSRAAFSARFTNLVGQSPIAYLTGWRMTLAADALRDTDATVAAVAHEVGYENPFAFSTAFKRAYAQSPMSWRRNRTEPPVGG